MNARLAHAHALLLPWFDRLPRACHPWWWPEGEGTSVTDWGLLDADGLAASLGVREGRAGTASGAANCGSVAGEAVRYWILLDAPPARGQEGPALDGLPRWVRALGIEDSAHVTSVRKFRPGEGALPDAAVLDAARVLAEEARAVPPVRVFAARNARRTLRAVLEVLRALDDADAPTIQALIEVHGREGRMPHEAGGRGVSLDDATLLLDAWRGALVRSP